MHWPIVTGSTAIMSCRWLNQHRRQLDAHMQNLFSKPLTWPSHVIAYSKKSESGAARLFGVYVKPPPLIRSCLRTAGGTERVPSVGGVITSMVTAEPHGTMSFTKIPLLGGTIVARPTSSVYWSGSATGAAAHNKRAHTPIALPNQ